MSSIIIQSPGLFSTIQDSGRYGYQRYGMPVSGAMDLLSLSLANILVGNEPGEACLEATLTGPEILFTGDTLIAVTGADMDPVLNGKSIALNTALKVRAGDRLGFRGLKNGCRTYIAFAGGMDVREVMGSRSTYTRARTGGLEGRALIAGDEIRLVDTEVENRLDSVKIPQEMLPQYPANKTIRITTGPEAPRFEFEGIRNFLTTEYRITDHSDRMGYRLSGKIIRHKEDRADIVSAGIAPGTIQVPGDGQPIILMADRQTSGGYARLANVISTDISLVAQMKPGDNISFRQVSLDEAQNLFRERKRILRSLTRHH